MQLQHVFFYELAETETGSSVEFKISLVYTEFQDSQGYAEKPCVKNKKLSGLRVVTPLVP